jgi:hypothetical protein
MCKKHNRDKGTINYLGQNVVYTKKMKISLPSVLAVTFLTICSWNSAAQQTPDSPVSQPQPPATPAQGSNSGKAAPGTSNDRLFFTLPNFLTLENAGNVAPLTTAQKYKETARSTFDPVQFAWYGLLAGISQASNSEPGYGQGSVGYAKRYGAAFADGTIENLMTRAVLPSLLHEDPRYFQLGKGGAAHRTWYAVSRIFVTRTDSGSTRFNYSEIFGSAASAGISTYSYHPQADRTLANTLSVWYTQVGYDGISFLAKEFWPDIRRKLRKSK